MPVYLSYKARLIHLKPSIEISLISGTRPPYLGLVSTAEVYPLRVRVRKVLSGGHPFSRRRDCSRAPLRFVAPYPPS